VSGAGPLTGAWRRAGLIVDGVRVKDRCDVLWLQSQDWYADLRIPLPGAAGAAGPESVFARAWAFAGTASWDPPLMTWEHHLDSEPEPRADSNRLELDGTVAIERGEIWWDGRAVPFCEEWQRISPLKVEMSVELDDNRAAIAVGPWRIVIHDQRPYGPFHARRYERDGGKWQACGSLRVPGDS
jgi:hypothetical protein